MGEKVVTVVTQTLNERLKALLESLLPDVKFNYVQPGNVKGFSHHHVLTESELKRCLDSEIIIGDNCFLGQIAYSAPKLKWFQGTYAGVNVPFESLQPIIKERGAPHFVATRFTGDSYGKLMADYCISYIIALERGFIEHRDLQSGKNWSAMKDATPNANRRIEDTTVGIIGFGSIGKVLAQELRKMGATLVAFSRTEKSQEEMKAAGVSFHSTNLEEVLSRCEYIINILPHTPATIGLLNNKMKFCAKSSVFINLGRGSVISSSEIIKALDEGWLGRAVLDVFEEEPLPPSCPLWDHPKVIVTPHISAVTRPVDMARLFQENYKRFISGEKLLYPISWEDGY